MDAFLAEMRFDQHLSRLQISLDKASALTEWSQDSLCISLRRLFAGYLNRAFKLTMSRVYIKAQTIMGRSLDVSVQKETLSRYERSLGFFAAFLVNLQQEPLEFRQSIIPIELEDSLERLFSTCRSTQSKLRDALQALHDFLVHILFNPVADTNNIPPFYLSCSSVLTDEYKKDRFRFCHASELTHTLPCSSTFPAPSSSPIRTSSMRTTNERAVGSSSNRHPLNMLTQA